MVLCHRRYAEPSTPHPSLIDNILLDLPNPPPTPQQVTDLLEPQPRGLGINQQNATPPTGADDRIAQERLAGTQPLHHGQESDGGQTIRGPVRRGRQAGTQGSDGEGEEFGLLPWDAA